MEDWDIEGKALNNALIYMEQADERARERFLFHLTHRFFPKGRFEPIAREFHTESLMSLAEGDLYPGRILRKEEI